MSNIAALSAPDRQADATALWGILGGMGPRASAEFLKTIYEDSDWAREQEAPRVVLLSDPTMPDRTTSLLAGRDDLLRQRLIDGIARLFACGATNAIVCCLTIHPLLAELPLEWRARVVSLVDVIFDVVTRSRARHLLICTDGTRQSRLFESHPAWPAVRDRVVLPAAGDQRRVHDLLYAIKEDRYVPEEAVAILHELMDTYGVSSYIAGCTEAHILAKDQARLTGRDRRDVCIDPLTSIIPIIAGRAPVPRLARPA